MADLNQLLGIEPAVDPGAIGNQRFAGLGYNNPARLTADAPLKGVWTHASPASTPAGFWPNLTNVDLPGGVITNIGGNEVFLDNYYPTGVPTLLVDRRIAGAQTEFFVAQQSTGSGGVYKWVTNTWVPLRTGLTGSTTAALWWSWVQYGTDLYISNPYDGVYRYDGNTLVPQGAKPIAQMEADEAALWAGGAADTAVFAEGVSSRKISTGADPAASVTMVYTPSTAIDTATGRYQGAPYLVSKVGGTDFYHFRLRVTDISLLDTAVSNVIFTTSAGNTLAFPASAWATSRAGTLLNVATAADNTWIDIYLPPVNGTQVGIYDPTSVASITFTLNSTGASVDVNIDDFYTVYQNTFPAVQIIAEWKNMLWGARTIANPDTLYFTPVQAPDQFDPLATFPIKARGQSITGLSSYFSQLTVGCDTETHSISGSTSGYTYPAYVFDQQHISHELGCSSHRSIIEMNNRLYWWYDGMIVEYRGSGVTKLSYPVDPTLALVDKTKLDYIVGAPFQTKNQGWWTFKRTAGSVNDRVLRYDYVLGAFLLTDGLATPLLLRTYNASIERLLSVDANDNDVNRRVFRQDSTTLKFMSGGTNTDIVYVCEPPPQACLPDSTGWDYLMIQYLANTGSITISYRGVNHLRELVAKSYTSLGTINQATTGEFGKIPIGDNYPWLQLKLGSTAVPFQIQCPITIYTIPQMGTDSERNV